MAKILVSACLLGCECRYKNDGCKNDRILALSKEHTLIPICPEQAGGLSTPRPPAEIQGENVITGNGKVITSNGWDVTLQYMKGAAMALYIALLNNVDFAILKAKSPSCGKGKIYDGTYSGKLIDGNGISAQLLMDNGFKVFTEEELDLLPL